MSSTIPADQQLYDQISLHSNWFEAAKLTGDLTTKTVKLDQAYQEVLKKEWLYSADKNFKTVKAKLEELGCESKSSESQGKLAEDAGKRSRRDPLSNLAPSGTFSLNGPGVSATMSASTDGPQRETVNGASTLCPSFITEV